MMPSQNRSKYSLSLESRYFGFIIVACLVFVGLLLRIPAASMDLWIDEVWTLAILENTHSLPGVFQINHDNNHLLSSLYVLLVRQWDDPLIYRSLAIGSGVGLGLLGWVYGSRFGPVGKIVISLLLLVSLPLYLSSITVRGYAPMLFCGFASFLALERAFLTRSHLLLGVHVAMAIAAMLFQFSFIFLFIGLLAYGVFAARNQDKQFRRAWGIWVLVLLIALAFLWFFYLRTMGIGGASQVITPIEAIFIAAIQTVGVTGHDALIGLPVLLIIIGLSSIEIKRLFIYDKPFFAMTIACLAVSPVIIFTLLPAVPTINERYFLTLSLIVILLVGSGITRLILLTTTPLRMAGMLAFLIITITNVWSDMKFIKQGSGSYRLAIQDIVAATESETITVSTDHDFRNLLLLRYHLRSASPDVSFEYSYDGLDSEAATQWYISHRHGYALSPESTLTGTDGRKYELVAEYPASPLRGLSWFLYLKK